MIPTRKTQSCKPQTSFKRENQSIKTCLHSPKEIISLLNEVFSTENLKRKKNCPNFLPIKTTRLSKIEKQNISANSVFIIDSKCIRRWTDGFKWSEPSPGDFWSISLEEGLKTKKNSFSNSYSESGSQTFNSPKKITKIQQKKIYGEFINPQTFENKFFDFKFMQENNAEFLGSRLIKKTCKFYYQENAYLIVCYSNLESEISNLCCQKFKHVKEMFCNENTDRFKFMSLSFLKKERFYAVDRNVEKFLHPFFSELKIMPHKSKINLEPTNQIKDEIERFRIPREPRDLFCENDGSIMPEEDDFEQNFFFINDEQKNIIFERGGDKKYVNRIVNQHDFFPQKEKEVKWNFSELMCSSTFDIPVLKSQKQFFTSKGSNKEKNENQIIKISDPDNFFNKKDNFFDKKDNFFDNRNDR